MNAQTRSAQSGGADVPGPVQLTRSGIAQLQQTVRGLREVMRPQILARARQGQLFMDSVQGAETAAAARQDLAAVDRQIADLETLLAGAQVVGEGPAPANVQPGFPFTVRQSDGTTRTLTIVSTIGASPAQGLISSDSPAARALLGKAPGASVTVGEGDEALTLTVQAIGRDAAGATPTPEVRTP